MILVSDDSKGPGGGRYSPLWESKRSAVINRRVAIFLRLTSDGVCDGAELGRSGEHPVIQHPLHVCHVHGHEELEDPWNPARPGLRPRFLDPVRLAEVPNVVQGGQEHPLFELLGRAPEHRPPLPHAGSRPDSSRGSRRIRSVTADGAGGLGFGPTQQLNGEGGSNFVS